MNLIFSIAIFVSCLGLALLPFMGVHGLALESWVSPQVVAALNLFGWTLVLTLLIYRYEFRRILERGARQLGIKPKQRSNEALLERLISEVIRKNSCFSINLVERKITSREEFSRTLERIVALSYRLLGAESVELALFDRESGLFHSSFVIGKPFRSSAQVSLAGFMQGEEEEISPDVIVYPISFAGNILGSLRVGLSKGRLPTVGDQEAVRILALQASLAIINGRYTEELLRLKRVSEESVKAKTGFLANLSHELRGPLGIMLNASELVIDGLCGPINADQSSTLKMVRTNGEHLLELVNDVLDYAKIESGKVKPSKIEMLVGDLLQDLCNVVRTQADAKSHKLVCKPSNEPLVIACDRRHARQMLINMLTNAIKYTPDGGIIEVWAERIPGNKVKINVKDSGIGIGLEDRHLVFEAFQRVESTYALTQVGTGLGMPSTKRLAEVNGGSIDFTSITGQGSHFWLIFPAESIASLELIGREQEPAPVAGRGDSVLLVERQESERDILGRYLSHRGFRVVTAQDKFDILDALGRYAVNLAILDNDVVDSSGGEIIRSIRAIPAHASLPIVMLSSRAFVFDIEKYLRLGVDRCVSKPIDLNSFSRIVRELIDNRERLGGHKGGDSKAPSEKVALSSQDDDLLH